MIIANKQVSNVYLWLQTFIKYSNCLVPCFVISEDRLSAVHVAAHTTSQDRPQPGLYVESEALENTCKVCMQIL